MFFQNYFFMVEFIVVRHSLLARLAAVSVWQRAVNRQPGYRSGNSKGRRPSRHHFQKIWNFQKKLSSFFNFCKSPGWIELWNFKIISTFQYHFYKLQYVSSHNFKNYQALSGSNDLRKLIFMVKSICVQPPLLACLATVSVLLEAGGKPSTWFPPGTRRAVHNTHKLVF